MVSMFIRKITSNAVLLPVLLILSNLVWMAGGCNHGVKNRSKARPIFRDAFSFYILDPGDFEITGPENPTQKEFLNLTSGEINISCGRFPGAFLATGAPEADLESFASNVIIDYMFLPGCHRWFLNGGITNVSERWFYQTSLLVRRSPRLTGYLTRIQKITHQRELEILPENEDRIVVIYYTFHNRDIYIITVAGPPEDLAAKKRDIEKLLGSIRLDPSEALAGAHALGVKPVK